MDPDKRSSCDMLQKMSYFCGVGPHLPAELRPAFYQVLEPPLWLLQYTHKAGVQNTNKWHLKPCFKTNVAFITWTVMLARGCRQGLQLLGVGRASLGIHMTNYCIAKHTVWLFGWHMYPMIFPLGYCASHM